MSCKCLKYANYPLIKAQSGITGYNSNTPRSLRSIYYSGFGHHQYQIETVSYTSGSASTANRFAGLILFPSISERLADPSSQIGFQQQTIK
jgi:hypothetical protein